MANINNLTSIPSYYYENINGKDKVFKKATVQDCDNLVSLYQRLNEDLDINLSIEESILYIKDLMMSDKFSIIYDTGILNIPYVSNNSNDDERLCYIKKDKNIMKSFNYIYYINPKGIPSSVMDTFSYIKNSLINLRKYSSYGQFAININHYPFNSPIRNLYDTLKKINNNISDSIKELKDEALLQVNSNIEYHKMQHKLNSITNKINDLKIKQNNLKSNIQIIKSKIKNEYFINNIDKIKCDIDSGYSKEIDENFNRIKKELIESKLISYISKEEKNEVKIESQNIINNHTNFFIPEDNFLQEPISTNETEYLEPKYEIGF